MWTPGDTTSPCIMDLIVAEKRRRKGTAKRIPDEHVRLANTCRLWLQVIHVSNITLPDGTLNPEYYHGKCQKETTLQFTTYPRPPQWVWAIWQEVLRNAIIKRRDGTDIHDIVHAPIERNLTPVPAQLPMRVDVNFTLQQIIDQLPTPYRNILGDIMYPVDDRLALAKALQNGTLTIYSDSTVLQGCGAHVFTLRTETDIEDAALTGSAPTTGDPDTISSLCTEHFGFLAGVLVVRAIVQKYQVTSGNFHGAVDNMAVVQRMNEGIDPEVGPKRHLATDYDVWKETEHILSRLPVTASLRHVKGHQDDLHKKGYSGPLDRDAHWNVRMDSLAKKARLTMPTTMDTMFASTRATLFCNGHPLTMRESAKIRSQLLDNQLRDYITDKEEWTKEIFETVDWTAFQYCMGKLTIHKRINVAKYVFNWQNTGRQKQHFEDSAARSERRTPEIVNACPLGCGCKEDSQHYLRCQVLKEAKIIQRDLSALSKWFKKQNTLPELAAVIMCRMKHWIDTGECQDIWEISESPYREDIIDAIAEQNNIGWDNALKGRLSTLWGSIYMRHRIDTTDEIPVHLSATWWTGELIRQILYFSLATWQHRNEYLHNKDAAENRIRERTEALVQMAAWFDKAHQFPQEDKVHFARTYLD